MSSNTIVINNGTGQQVLDQLNSIFPAIASAQYGSTDPSTSGYAVSGMWWVDTGTNTVKQRNSANTAWIIQGSFDATTGYISWGTVGHVQWQYTLESGYVKLNGATVSRTDYDNLWSWAQAQSLTTSDNTTATTKHLFGTGDGSTTFVLPNLEGLSLQGGSTVNSIGAGLPNITGYFKFNGDRNNTGTAYGCMYKTSDVSNSYFTMPSTANANDDGNICNFDASKSNSIYGSSTTVQPPSVKLIPQIKY